MENLSTFFDKIIQQRSLKLEIDGKTYGDSQLVDFIKSNGVLMDIQLYEQIIYNVFANACKFNQVSGLIYCRIAFSMA